MRDNRDRFGPAAIDNGTNPAAAVSGLGFVVPTEFVELPSKGKFYPDEHPLHKQETVEIKYMTAKEEDILASSTLIKKGLVIDRLLDNILVPDIDPTTLLVGDRSAIMIAARISSYGYPYKAHITCASCLKEQDYDFDLRKTNLNQKCFDLTFLRKNKIVFNEEKCIFEMTLPTSKIILGVRMLDGQDEKEALDNEGQDRENIVTNAISKFASSVDGKEDPAVVSQFINNMLASDSRYLRAVIADLTPSIDLKQSFVCDGCGEEEDREVPLTAEFFWPE